MSERYSRLFSLSENLYAVGSPVVIAAGTLLKDNQTGKIVAQLKMRSISPKTIIGAKVILCLFDNAGKAIGDPVDFDYLDLRAARDAEFGQKTPVPVPESKARSYQAAIQEVVFADKTTWTASDAAWEPLPAQKTLDAVLVNSELIKQYKIAVGSNFSYYPLEEKDLWYCACGAWNHEGEACHACHRTLFELQTIDLEQLAKDKDTRLAQEAAAAEAKAAAEKAAAEAAKKKTAKILKIAIPSICAVIAIALLVTKVVIPNSKYNDAVELMAAEKYEEAISAFEAMDGFKDSADQIAKCKDAIAAAEHARIEAENESTYQEAVALMNAGKYDKAVTLFTRIITYKDSEEKKLACLDISDLAKYTEAERLLESGDITDAAIAFGKLGDYQDSRERSFVLWKQVIKENTIVASYSHTVGVKQDGTVVAAGSTSEGRSNVSNWRGIVAISSINRHTVGLRDDGTVVAVGWNDGNQCAVSAWEDIVAIATGAGHTVGLKSNGTPVAIGCTEDNRCDISNWTNIVGIAAGYYHTVGLKDDGTVIATGGNLDGQCDVSSWKNITDIFAGGGHTVGLKSDGTAIAVGNNDNGRCDVSDWSDIVSIAAGQYHTVGLKSDGTVVAVGRNKEGQCNVSGWKNIVAISAGSHHTVGLKSDGTLVAVGWNECGQCNVSKWKDIKLPN